MHTVIHKYHRLLLCVQVHARERSQSSGRDDGSVDVVVVPASCDLTIQLVLIFIIKLGSVRSLNAKYMFPFSRCSLVFAIIVIAMRTAAATATAETENMVHKLYYL